MNGLWPSCCWLRDCREAEWLQRHRVLVFSCICYLHAYAGRRTEAADCKVGGGKQNETPES